MGEQLPDPCPGCGQHHDLDEEVTQPEGPFVAMLFVRPDGEWAIRTTLDEMATLAVFNDALRAASAHLS